MSVSRVDGTDKTAATALLRNGSSCAGLVPAGVEDLVSFDEGCAHIDRSKFSNLPTFAQANRIDARSGNPGRDPLITLTLNLIAVGA